MTKRKVLALWLATALVMMLISGAATFAVLSDKETVSVTVSASVNAEPATNTAALDDGQNAGAHSDTEDAFEFVDSDGISLHAQTRQVNWRRGTESPTTPIEFGV